MNIDPREGRPSASSIPRTKGCPGWLRLQKSLRPEKEEETEDAASGTRIHAALASGNPDGLDADEQEIFERCQRTADAISDDWSARKKCQVFREQRLWFTDNAFSGQADVIYKQFSRALVLDFKSVRWGKHTDSDENLQLRSLAILAWRNYPTLTEITVAIVQDGHTPTLCTYDETALEMAEAEIMRIVDASDEPDAPLTAGAWCKWCPNAPRCPALHSQVETFPAPLSTRDLELSPAEVVEFWDRCKVVEKACESFKGWVKRSLEERLDAFPGLRLAEGSERRKVTDLQTVFTRSLVHPDKFRDACSITITALKSVVKEATQLKGKALDERLAAILDGCVETKKSAASVERVEKQPEPTQEAQ